MDWADMTHDEKIKHCRTGLANGESASVMARGAHTTRNAVLGIIHRNKLNPTGARPLSTVAGPKAPRKPKEPRQSVRRPRAEGSKPLPVFKAPPRPIDGPGIPFLEGTDGKCRFPRWPDGLNPVPAEARMICGAETSRTPEGKNIVYCDYHQARTRYRPSAGQDHG